MSATTSTKPYFLRAIYEWCVDNGLTPHLMVTVDGKTRVPPAYVKDGEIVLNINYSATKGLLIDNEAVSFSARFGGVPFDIYVPIATVRGIFARENGQGMFFEPAEQVAQSVLEGAAEGGDGQGPDNPPPSGGPGRPALKLVK